MAYSNPWYNNYQLNIFVFVKDEPLIALSNQICTLRKEKSLFQEQLALKADADRSYMGGIERGERNVIF
ncbi:MAG: helix-turn-helix domain-containing protein [Tannerellaceae bacterium]|nr:helix-turn-helix domain-containing protein [Tannerellaceae bacterium]